MGDTLLEEATPDILRKTNFSKTKNYIKISDTINDVHLKRVRKLD